MFVCFVSVLCCCFFCFKQKTAYELRISDWSSDVCSSDLLAPMKSIVESALAQGLRQPIHLYFGARMARDLYMGDRFAGLAARHENFRFTPVLSEPRSEERRVGKEWCSPCRSRRCPYN